MFADIVERINNSICKKDTGLFIGVLDIFGFEDFKVLFQFFFSFFFDIM